MNTKVEWPKLPRIIIGRCLKCGYMRVVNNYDYTCYRCGETMADIDKLFEERVEEDCGLYRKKIK